MLESSNDVCEQPSSFYCDEEQGIFDSDVHPVPKDGLTSLTPYLPKAWKERFDRKQARYMMASTCPSGSGIRTDRSCARTHALPTKDTRIPGRGSTASTKFCSRNWKRIHRRRRRAGREVVRSAATFRSPANAGCSTASSAWSE
jgi:hypothetical protein